MKYDDSDSEDLDHGEMHGCLKSMDSGRKVIRFVIEMGLGYLLGLYYT